jgi:hypothetical protein
MIPSAATNQMAEEDVNDPAAAPVFSFLDSFYSRSCNTQSELIHRLFGYLSDPMSIAADGETILFFLAVIFADPRFLSVEFDLLLGADLVMAILSFSLSPSALQVVTTGIKINPSLHGDGSICAAVHTLVESRGAEIDLSGLTCAFLGLGPLPPDWLIGLFCGYNQQILDGELDHSVASALNFFTRCAERLGLGGCSDYGIDVWAIAAKVPQWLRSSSRHLVGESICFLAAIETCDEATCDFLIDLMRMEQEAADESEWERTSKDGLLCRTVNLFMICREQLRPKFPEILDLLMRLVPHTSSVVRFTIIAGILALVEGPSFSPELCGILLEFYDTPIHTRRIFRILIDWAENADLDSLDQFAMMTFEKGDELADFLDESDLPEHILFGNYLRALDKYAAAQEIQFV